METQALKSIGGDIKKIIRDIENIAKIVIVLPEDIEKIPGSTYKIFQEASKEFDKANKIRKDILADIERIVPLIEDIFKVSEHFVEGYETWQKTPGAVAGFKGKVQGFFSSTYALPAKLKTVDLKHFIGEALVADALIDLAELSLPLDKAVTTIFLDLLPDLIYYLLYLATEAHPSWHTLPDKISDNLDEIVKLQTSAAAPSSGALAATVLAGVAFLSDLVSVVLSAILDSISRDAVVGADLAGEGFSTTLGPNPARPPLVGIRTFFDALTRTFNYASIATRILTADT